MGEWVGGRGFKTTRAWVGWGGCSRPLAHGGGGGGGGLKPTCARVVGGFKATGPSQHHDEVIWLENHCYGCAVASMRGSLPMQWYPPPSLPHHSARVDNYSTWAPRRACPHRSSCAGPVCLHCPNKSQPGQAGVCAWDGRAWYMCVGWRGTEYMHAGLQRIRQAHEQPSEAHAQAQLRQQRTCGCTSGSPYTSDVLVKSRRE